MCWLKWEIPCNPKTEGGKGFRDMMSLNLALPGPSETREENDEEPDFTCIKGLEK